ARLFVVALPRSQSRAAERRVSLVRRPLRRHGGVHGRRYGGVAVRRSPHGPAGHDARNRRLGPSQHRHSAALSPGPFVDMAARTDARTVAPRCADLDMRRLATTHGIGVSFHTTNATVL